MSWSFMGRCTVFGLLWAAGVVAAMVWAMETAPTAWGLWKLGAAGVAAFVFGVFTYVRDPESAWSNTPGAGSVKPLAKLSLLAALAIPLAACATPQVTMPVGVAAIAYGQARSDYGAMRVLATQACARGKLDKATCDQLVAVDTRMQVLRQTIERSLLDPQTPVDWAAVLQYTEAVMGVVLKLGVIP